MEIQTKLNIEISKTDVKWRLRVISKYKLTKLNKNRWKRLNMQKKWNQEQKRIKLKRTQPKWWKMMKKINKNNQKWLEMNKNEKLE